MGELHATMNVTLDGCCEHTRVIADDELHAWATDLVNRSAALLFGRVTYNLFRDYWPAVATGQGPAGEIRFGRLLETKAKYLVSRQDPAPGWNTSRVAFGQNGEAIGRLKRELGGPLLLLGSPTLARALVEVGLIDEYHLAIQPVFAGHGPTFLAGLSAPKQPRLVDTRRLPSGVAIHRYQLGTANR